MTSAISGRTSPAEQHRAERTRSAAVVDRAPMPATVLKVLVAARRARHEGRYAARPRSDEDGAAAPRAGRRDRHGGPLPRGRAGAGRRGPRGSRAVLKNPPRVWETHHHRRSRTARRAAERARVGLDRRQDRVRQPAERRGPAGHRSVGVRQPEVGAADGRRRRGLRRHRAPPRHPLHRARAQPRRPRARARRRRHRDRDLRRLHRNVQPQEHQPEHRRVARRPTRGVCDARTAAGLRVRGYLSTAFGCPFEGDGRARTGRRRRRAAARPRRLRGRGQRHHRHRASRPGAARARGGAGARAGRRRSRCTSTTRAAPRSPTCWPRCRSASRRSTRRPAASAAARTRRARPAISPPTI